VKILTKKKIDEILQKLGENEICLIESNNLYDALIKITKNNADIAYAVGGISGIEKVRNIFNEKTYYSGGDSNAENY
jgi:hypothetical protein